MDLVPAVGDWIEVRWPCQSDSADASSASIDPESADAWLWFKALIVQGGRKFLLRFEDGGEAWNSLRKLQWRSLKASSPALREREESPDETVMDQTGFVHSFEIEEEFLRFCDSLHMRREELGDKSRGDAAYGEALSGGLVSVLIRREALPEGERDVYNRLHQRCIQEVPLAWPGWIQRAAGKSGRARQGSRICLTCLTWALDRK